MAEEVEEEEDLEFESVVSEPVRASSVKRNYSVDTKKPNDLLIILDNWVDCELGDKYVCIPPEIDKRYDLAQLTIFQAYPTSVPYSEVGVWDDPESGTQSAAALKGRRFLLTVKQTVKGNPLHHFPPASSRRTSLAKPSVLRTTATAPPVSKPDVNSPIVIFHDLYRSQTEWVAFAADLAAMLRRRVIAVDLRNHGTSPTSTTHCGIAEYLADFRNLFKELKLSAAKLTLIGHGLGGWCAMIYTLIYPYKVRNLVIIEAKPTDNNRFLNEILELESILVRVQTPPRGRAIANLKLKVYDFLIDSIANVNLCSYIVQNIVVNDVIGKPEKWELKKKQIVSSLMSFTKFPKFLNLSDFDKPALFVASESSKHLQTKDEPAVLKLFPQAKFVYYQKVTSNPHVDLFDDFLDMVKNFLEGDKL